MKRLLLIIPALLVVISASAQTTPSSKVTQGLSASEIAALTPEKLDWYNFLANNMCIVSDNPEKAAGLPEISSYLKAGKTAPSEYTQESFNPLVFNIQPLPTQSQYFRIGDTGKTIFYYSAERLQTLYQRSKSNSTEK